PRPSPLSLHDALPICADDHHTAPAPGLSYGAVAQRTHGAVMLRELNYYLRSQSTSLPRYIIEQTVMSLLGGIPGLIGVGLRGIADRKSTRLNSSHVKI